MVSLRRVLFRMGGGAGEGDKELVARGEQHVAFLRREGDRMVPTPVPEALREALRAYADT